MGVILYVLISGAPPFYGANDLAILESVKKGHYEFDRTHSEHSFLVPVWNTITPECKDLIGWMLKPEKERLTSQQVLDHPWIKKMADQAPSAPLPPLILKNLKVFRGAEKVKKAVLTYLATQLSEKEIEPLKTLFLSLDKNGDGRLSLEEIRSGFVGRPEQGEFMDIMLSMDTDKSGYIDYNGSSSAVHG